MRAEIIIERVENLRRAQILGLAHGRREILPEIAQHLLPVDLVIGDPVELRLEIGGEIIFHISA